MIVLSEILSGIYGRVLRHARYAAGAPRFFLEFTILVIHHRILGADEVFVVGDALGGERHQGGGIDVESPGHAAKQEDSVAWVVEGVGVVSGGGSENAAFTGGVGPEGVAADFGVFEGGVEIFGSSLGCF